MGARVDELSQSSPLLLAYVVDFDFTLESLQTIRKSTVGVRGFVTPLTLVGTWLTDVVGAGLKQPRVFGLMNHVYEKII